MELRHLRYFITVAEELHFGRAAQRLGIAQPPLSLQIKALEEELGVLLFARTKRRVELTAAGTAFAQEVRQVLAGADRAVLVARRVARGEIGRLEVGFTSGAVYGKVPTVFQLMRARYPEVSLNLRELTTEEQMEAIDANRLDVGLIRPPAVVPESLRMTVIAREPLVAVLPKTHRLAGQEKIAAGALAGEPFVQVPRHVTPGFFDHFMGACLQAGFFPRIVQEARTTQTIVSLVAVGMGVSIVPDSLRDLQRTGVVYVSLDPSPFTELALIRRRTDDNPALHQFLEIVREVTERE